MARLTCPDCKAPTIIIRIQGRFTVALVETCTSCNWARRVASKKVSV